MSRQKEVSRRAEILRIAGELFLKEGYAGTSMSRVAAEVGGSKATLYAYFDSKETLFKSYIDSRTQSERRYLFSVLQEDLTPEEALKALGVKFLLMTAREDSVALKRLLYSESVRFPELGANFHNTTIMDGRKHILAFFARLEESGGYKFPDPDLAAEQFLSLCQAKHLDEVMLGMRKEVPLDEAKEVVDSAVAMFLGAYRVSAD